MKPIKVQLTKKAVRALRRPINGDGGFQNLLRLLAKFVRPDGVLVLWPELAERVSRYRTKYGNGGFQGRLGQIASSRLRRATWRTK